MTIPAPHAFGRAERHACNLANPPFLLENEKEGRPSVSSMSPYLSTVTEQGALATTFVAVLPMIYLLIPVLPVLPKKT